MFFRIKIALATRGTFSVDLKSECSHREFSPSLINISILRDDYIDDYDF